jgi:hypothetical protein
MKSARWIEINIIIMMVVEEVMIKDCYLANILLLFSIKGN